MHINRRKFIQIGSFASASLMVPQFLSGFQQKANPQKNNKILVVVQLSGGNDGLNTVIPYRNDIYYRNRPNLAIKKEDAIALTDEAGLHPSLKGVKQLYENGKISIINNVGYPEPNRSHFRSMDIWQTASGARENETTGWLGRYLDNLDDTINPYNTIAIEMDDSLSLALKGEEKKAIAIRDINQFHKATANSYFKQLASHEKEHSERLAGYLYKTLRESTSAADYLLAQSKIYTTKQIYPDSQLGKRLKTIGSLILSNTATNIFYVSHGGFDTHVGQVDRQTKLLKDFDEALLSFYADLKDNERENDVLIMTFSEFGRRVAQNASNGTDHGTANNMFLIGGGIKKAGLYNPLNNLTDLDEGDLKYDIDFRQVYATVLDKWMETPAKSIINKKFDNLGFI